MSTAKAPAAPSDRICEKDCIKRLHTEVHIEMQHHSESGSLSGKKHIISQRCIMGCCHYRD